MAVDNYNAGMNAFDAGRFEEAKDWFEKGVKSVSAPVTPTIGPNKGGRAIYMIDPDGVRVELIQSSKSFGEYKGE